MIPVAVLVQGAGAASAWSGEAARVAVTSVVTVEHVSLVQRAHGFALVCWMRGPADARARVELQLAVVRTLERAGVVPVPDARTVVLGARPGDASVRRSGRHR